jgi:hypothetical protein
MRKLHLVTLLLAAPCLVFGQLDDDTVTVTASRLTSLQPDQVVLGVYVNSAATVALDDVVALLGGTGITAANVSSVSLGSTGLQNLMNQWIFTLPVPFSKLNGTLAALAQIQENAPKARPPLAVAFTVQGMQVSPDLQAANPCPHSALVSDARRQAQNFADAAGVKLGPIAVLWDGPAAALQAAVVPVLLRNGDFSQTNGGVLAGSLGASFLLGNPLVSAPACSLTVQFQIVR